MIIKPYTNKSIYMYKDRRTSSTVYLSYYFNAMHGSFYNDICYNTMYKVIIKGQTRYFMGYIDG